MIASVTSCAKHLIAGTESAFQIFDLPPFAKHFRRIRNEQAIGGARQVCIIPGHPVIAVVLRASTTERDGRSLVLFDSVRNEVLSEVHFEDRILNVLMNTKRLVVVLDRHMHLFDIDTLLPLPQIRTTNPLNVEGAAALSPLFPDGTCWLAFPQSMKAAEQNRGDLCLLEASSCEALSVIQAHNARVSVVQFSCNGTRFATCSTRGQKIRVYSCPDFQLLHQLHRGQSEATIYSLALNATGDIVAATSSTGTLHVFRETNNTSVRDRIGPDGVKSFAKLNTPKTRTLCALSESGNVLSVIHLQPGEMGGKVLQYSIEGESTSLLGENPF